MFYPVPVVTECMTNIEDTEYPQVIMDRLLNSEEHACEAAVPEIAEEAVELIKVLLQRIELLKMK